MSTKRNPCKIIAVMNQKGGCTKTATTMQLGGAFAEAGVATAIVDMDPQSTATLWSMQSRPGRAQFPAKVVSLGAMKEAFLDKLAPLMEAHELIIIDCPPAVESQVPWASLAVADLALIPVVPVMDNVWASKIAEELVFKAREQRKQTNVQSNLEAVFLLQQQRRGTVFEVCEDVLREGARIPILKTKIGMRNIYPESQLFGTHVTAMGKTPAAAEIAALREEVAKLLQIKISKAVKK